MSKQTESSLLIASSVAALYQRLLRGVASYEELGIRLLGQIETAHTFRQVEQVRELAKILLSLPIREYRLIGQYYLVWCKCRESEYQSRLLERIVEETNTYKAKALISRGTFELYQGNPEQALYFYAEGLKTSPTISEFIGLSIAIAAAKGEEGFHRAAIEDMEKIAPIVRHAEPRLYYDFLNSYAVELIETGRLDQAEDLSTAAVSSPFGPFYGEWRETLSGIRSKRKRRSTVAFSRALIEREYEAELEIQENPIHKARVQVAIDFMKDNLHRSIALSEMAAVINLSPSHFSYLFRTQTGTSPGEYLIKLRMEKARQLLANGFLSVKQIMVSVGYSTKSNFLRQFKKYFGVGPYEYRKRSFAGIDRGVEGK